MKTNWLKVARAVSIAFVAAAVPACGAGDLDGYDEDEADFASEELTEAEDIELGTLEQRMANCSNPDGTNAVMAALAVAAGKELGRWQAMTDFEVYSTSGQYEGASGWQQAIRLTSGNDAFGKPRGKTKCGGSCPNVQAMLDMQYENLRNKIWIQAESSTNKTLVDPGALRSRMVAKLGEQKICDQNAKDNDVNRCPVEKHKLTPAGTASLGGCGVHYKFSVAKDTGATLQYPAQLKWKLNFADQTNGWVDFKNLGGGQVAIDPTYGLNEGVTGGSGSCAMACTKFTTTNILGQCCSCGGYTKAWARASTTNSNIYACQ